MIAVLAALAGIVFGATLAVGAMALHTLLRMKSDHLEELEEQLDDQASELEALTAKVEQQAAYEKQLYAHEQDLQAIERRYSYGRYEKP